MFLGTLLFGVTALGSALNCAKENHDMKKETSRLDQNGNLTYSDRLGRRYVNNEMVYETVKYDKYGNRHCYTVGCNSRRIYGDEYERQLTRQREWDKKNKKFAIERGWLGYEKYLPEARKGWLAEVSTDRFISSIWRDPWGNYRKFYSFDDRFRTSRDDDYGVIISKEEYDGLEKNWIAHSAALPGIRDKMYKEKEKEERELGGEKSYKEVEKNTVLIKQYVCIKNFQNPQGLFCGEGEIFHCDKKGFLRNEHGKCVGNINTFLRGYFEEKDGGLNE